MDESGTFRGLEIFTYKLFTFSLFLLFHSMLILIICSDRRAVNTLPVISEACHCNFNYIMKYDVKFKKIIITICNHYPINLLFILYA